MPAIGLCYIGRVNEPTSGATATVTTPLGAVSLHVLGSAGVTVGAERADVPDLPSGMAVDGVMLIRVFIATPVTAESPLLLEAAFDGQGDPETGEWLESMAFQTDRGVLQVAIRDREWLAGRGVVADYAEFQERGLKQTVLEAAAGTTLYASVAWRVGDGAAGADDASTWFAADLALPC